MPCLCSYIKTLEAKKEDLQNALTLLIKSNAAISQAKSFMQITANAYNSSVMLGRDMGMGQLIVSKGDAPANAVAAANSAVNTQLTRIKNEIYHARETDRSYHRRIEEERRRRAEQEKAEALAEKGNREHAIK